MGRVRGIASKSGLGSGIMIPTRTRPIDIPNHRLCERVVCDKDGYVTRLWLPWRGLSGIISPSIGNLTHPHHLNFSHNHLFGPILASSFSSLFTKLGDKLAEVGTDLGNLTHACAKHAKLEKLAQTLRNLDEACGWNRGNWSQRSW
ncbi:hypothetical protein WN944_006338 [Citrus x changshan-huyou]|uniref:Uncharacterized protein n=1 Tax=Citrus x changshan-huyou TaxID=2935761 RepID=A0AAP0QTR2_9ROSI